MPSDHGYLTKSSAASDFPALQTETAALLAAAVAVHADAKVSAVHGGIFVSAEQTGDDTEQSVAHGLGGAPTKAVALLTGQTNTPRGGVTTGLVVGNPTTPSAQATSAKSELALGLTRFDTTVRAKAGGTAGDAITVEVKADAVAGTHVTLTEGGNAVVIHFEDGVGTVAEAEAAIGTSALIEVKTASVGGGTLAAPGDVKVATHLASGTDGATTWMVNVSAGDVEVGGFMAHLTAAADSVLHETTNLLLVGEEQYVALVAVCAAGTVSMAHVHGTKAAIGAATAPTAADITTAIGHSLWVRLATDYLKRTADTTLVQTHDTTVKTAYGSTITAGTHDGTNCKFTVSAGSKYRILAWR